METITHSRELRVVAIFERLHLFLVAVDSFFRGVLSSIELLLEELQARLHCRNAFRVGLLLSLTAGNSVCNALAQALVDTKLLADLHRQLFDTTSRFLELISESLFRFQESLLARFQGI